MQKLFELQLWVTDKSNGYFLLQHRRGHGDTGGKITGESEHIGDDNNHNMSEYDWREPARFGIIINTCSKGKYSLLSRSEGTVASWFSFCLCWEFPSLQEENNMENIKTNIHNRLYGSPFAPHKG